MARNFCIIVVIILFVCVLYWTSNVKVQEDFVSPTVQTKTLTGAFTGPNNSAQFNLRGGNQVWECLRLDGQALRRTNALSLAHAAVFDHVLVRKKCCDHNTFCH